jgi:hypothetical protein
VLNELLIAERGVRQAGLEMVERHPDVHDAGRMPTLLVRLGAEGDVSSVSPVPSEARLWKLSDGQHNSFPFVQPKPPLWAVPAGDKRRENAVDKRADNSARRSALLALGDAGHLNAKELGDWPGAGLLNRLRERRQQLASLDGTEARVVPETIERFLRACDPAGGGPQHLLQATIRLLVAGLRESAQVDWLEVAAAILLGRYGKKRSKWEGSGALMFEATGAGALIADPKSITRVSQALRAAGGGSDRGEDPGTCGLTGLEGRLLTGNFPQPNLPFLGQTYIFAKNRDIPANDRYGRFSADAMAVGQGTAIHLDSALRTLTSEERRGVTWRAIPSEVSPQSDLLLAFVEGTLDAPAAATLTDEDDFAQEATHAARPEGSDSIAAFEKRTERLIEAVKATVGTDFRRTPVQLAVFRKVDPANRKVVYAGTASVAELYDAASGWVAGERNVPPWLSLPVLGKGERVPALMAPSHLAPLGVIPFSKQLFLRGGTERQEVVGIPAIEALGLFFESVAIQESPGRRRVARILRMALGRRAVLVSGAAHAMRRGSEFARNLDGREALRTVTLLGVLLHKLGRTKEGYMSDTAFKLGQLLAAADVVHAGYCADVRGGAVPPSLLGNQVFTMAQTAPAKALATLCRRWKPYDGWAKRAARERDRADKLVASGNKDEQQRGWDIRTAVRYARQSRELANQLAQSLRDCAVDDVFRAELLLGYIAGLPKPQKEEGPDHIGQEG